MGLGVRTLRPFPTWPSSNDQLGQAGLRHVPIHFSLGGGGRGKSTVKTEVTCHMKGNQPGGDSSDLVPTVSFKLRAYFCFASASTGPGI